MDKVEEVNKVENLEKYWDCNVERYGFSPQALDWGSWRSQRKRFEVLCRIIPDICSVWGRLFRNITILDVGCGLGNLIDYLRDKYDYPWSYTGIDISTKMVKKAEEHYPNLLPSRNPISFKVHDMVEALDRQYDYVIMSGVLTKKIGNPEEQHRWAYQILDNCWAATRKAMAFNMLSTHADHVNSRDFQYDPIKVLDHCMWFLGRKVTLDHTYMPHDFTITVHRAD